MSSQARRELIEASASELFAQRGYAGATIDEIASDSGVTPPVIYDHFSSKLDLYRRLLERHFADLRAIWREQLPDGASDRQAIPGAIDAWFAYVQQHPFAWRMLFRDTTGEPDVEKIHRQVIADSQAAITPLLVERGGALALGDPEDVEMAWVVMRGVLQGLALWWYEHQHVPREKVVGTAINALWIGYERLLAGEGSPPNRE